MDKAGVELLNNRYRLEMELGRGGMGSVHRAHDTLLDRTVAVKLLRETDGAGRERLLREAKAAAHLNHPHIVAVHDVGVAGEATYIVMEYVEGDSLDKRAHPGLAETVGYAGQVLEALEHAHAHGIVHRDVKPENIMVTPGGKVKLMDFGLARPIASRITSEGALVGTVFYVAPEQALGQAIDGRADLYALGVVLYELVAGRLPFTAEDPLAVISQHLYAPVVPPSTYNPALPPVLESLILSLLSKQADDRPPSAALVREALEAMELTAPAPRQAGAGLAGIARGRFVGRERELALCKSAWLEAVAGARRVVLVEGEAGVGKTRLATEVASQVTVLGGRLLRGECYAEGAAPYAPIGEIIRESLAGDGAKDLNLPGTVLNDLAVLSPALRRSTRSRPGGVPAEASAELPRLCESVVWLLERLSQRAPVMLLIEDLQWADSGTLCLVRYLAHRAQVTELCLLAMLTFRPVESVQARGLYSFLRELGRTGQTTIVELKPFTRDETRRMLEAMFQREITEEFLEGIQQETGGNPFFVEEACKTLVTQGKLYLEAGRWERGKAMAELGIPQSLRTAILERFTRLTPEAQDCLRRAAIIGQEFEVCVLQLASDLSRDQLDACLEEAERAQFIHVPRGESVAGQRYAFAHALMTQTIAAELSAIRTSRLHARVGEAIERAHAGRLEDMAPALGRHFARAGQADKAVGYLLAAGDAAQSALAFEDAIEAYEQAVSILDLLMDDARAAETRMKLGSLYHVAYRFGESRSAYRKGFVLEQARCAPDQVGWGGSTLLPSAPHPLRLHGRKPVILDPCHVTEDDDMTLLSHLLSGLVECDPGMNLIPEVAWRWDILEDGKKYIFHLWDDWRWSDGIPVTAGDFEFAWRRILDPQMGSPWREMLHVLRGGRTFDPCVDPPADSLGVRAVDDLTLSVELEHPAGYFLYMLAAPQYFPLPRHIVGAGHGRWADGAEYVGNGAFRLVSGGEGETWTLRRNPGYQGRFRGNVEQVDIHMRSEHGEGAWESGPEILSQYEAGSLDIAILPFADARRAKLHHSGQEVSWPGLAVYFVALNWRRAPLGDLRVRRAFGLGLDRSLLMALTYGDDTEPAAGGLVPPGLAGHSAGIGLSYDLREARRLLAEAGFAGGRGFPTLTVLHALKQERHDLACNLIDLWKEALGVQVQGCPAPQRELHERLQGGDYDMAILGWIADYPDPESFLRVLVSEYQSLQFDAEYASLVDQAGRTLDLRTRMALYARADRRLSDLAVFLPIFYGKGRSLVKPWIRREPKWWYHLGACWKDVIINPH
jgi:ABC-type oligopeptide transport system substrate-binding subunit/predicted Ser/Thr protein kinase